MAKGVDEDDETMHIEENADDVAKEVEENGNQIRIEEDEITIQEENKITLDEVNQEIEDKEVKFESEKTQTEFALEASLRRFGSSRCTTCNSDSANGFRAQLITS